MLRCATIAGLAAAAVLTSVATPALAGAPVLASAAKRHRPVVVHVAPQHVGPRVHETLLGVNSRWAHDGEGLWNVSADTPNSTAVDAAKRAGIRALRFPGGTDATMFDWKRAVGATRECQLDAHWHPGGAFHRASGSKAYGPSEFMQVVKDLGARPILMAPFVRETPRAAADWVEYMNARVGANPNGGFDWARVRAADGHPAPYSVRRWEVGNEANVAPVRYRFSRKYHRSVREYAFGGERHIRNEALGKSCNHPARGTPSDGQPHQSYSVLYPPVKPGSLSLKVNRASWHRVPHLGQAGPDAHVFRLNARTGDITFGDGQHGAIPRRGSRMHVAYANKYAGFFRFVRAMKAVDPHIDVCATWGKPSFPRLVGSRRYDCLTAHPMTNFNKTHTVRWQTPLEGHDRMMLALAARRGQVAQLRRVMPRRTPLWITEFDVLNGDYSTFRRWSASVSHALYMAGMQLMLLRMGLPWANGGDLITRGHSAVISDAPRFVFSAEAVERETLLPMLEAGGRVVGTSVGRNPLRSPRLHRAGSYPALHVVATRAHSHLWIAVLNLLPGRAVRAHVDVGGFHHGAKALRRRMGSPHFSDSNTASTPNVVRLHETTQSVGHAGFTTRFPAHSLTVFRLVRR